MVMLIHKNMSYSSNGGYAPMDLTLLHLTEITSRRYVQVGELGYLYQKAFHI